MQIQLIIYGVLIGLANIIPGVSGGTVAVILNVYDDLITSMETIFKKPLSAKKELFFIGKVGVGVLIGIALFSHMLTYAMEIFPEQTMGFFFGVIGASIPFIFKAHSDMSVTLKKSGVFVLFCIGLLSLVLLMSPDLTNKTVITSLSISDILFLFFSGVIASSTMIIPGISGSFMLLILGSYYPILHAVSMFSNQLITGDAFFSTEFFIISIVGSGALVGMVLCTKLIYFLLNTIPAYTYYGILGLIVGSLVHMGYLLGAVVSVSNSLSVGACVLIGAVFPLILTNKRT